MLFITDPKIDQLVMLDGLLDWIDTIDHRQFRTHTGAVYYRRDSDGVYRSVDMLGRDYRFPSALSPEQMETYRERIEILERRREGYRASAARLRNRLREMDWSQVNDHTIWRIGVDILGIKP